MPDLNSLSCPLSIRLHQELINFLYSIQVCEAEQAGKLDEATLTHFAKMKYPADSQLLLQEIIRALSSKPALSNEVPTLRPLVADFFQMTEHYLSFEEIAQFVKKGLNDDATFATWNSLYKISPEVGASGTYLYYAATQNYLLNKLVINYVEAFLSTISHINRACNLFVQRRLANFSSNPPVLPLWKGSARAFGKSAVGQYQFDPTPEIQNNPAIEETKDRKSTLRPKTKVNYRQFF